MAGQTVIAKNNGKTGEFSLQVYLLHASVLRKGRFLLPYRKANRMSNAFLHLAQ